MNFAVPLNVKRKSVENTKVPIDIETEKQRNELIRDNRIVVIKYSAVWCGPCQKITPEYRKMCNDDIKGVIYCEEDVDQELEGIPEKIKTIPVFHIYVDGLFSTSTKGTNLQLLTNAINEINK